MEKNKTLILKESNFSSSNLIENITINGINHNLMKKSTQKKVGNVSLTNILSNTYSAIKYLANPNINDNNTKLLTLGKVQSGKTIFFLNLLALSFDNGYDLGIIFGGTKTSLLDQNMERIEDEFSNNTNVVILSFSAEAIYSVNDYIKDGKKVIITILKNVSSQNANLHLLNKLIDEISHIPTIIIDDESDEHTPGAPNLKKKNIKAGITHHVITEIYKNFNISTLVFVTATPQANLLLSSMDDLTPDNLSLVYPGDDYIGGSVIHDSLLNDSIVIINDHENFLESIPQSFIESLVYFMLSTTNQRLLGIDKNYSMLVHPSSFTKIHTNVVEKINETIEDIKNNLRRKSDPNYFNFLDYLKTEYDKNNFKSPFSVVIDSLTECINEYIVVEYNTTTQGRIDIEELNYNERRHIIYVGGNMLGRGLTIPHLSTTYMYRDSDITAIDTLYQRARWLGYKREYLDIIKIYMPLSLANKFIITVESELDMWNTLENLSNTGKPLINFNRIFTLNDDKLLLTRKTVSKTITFERIKGGYNYDKSIFYRSPNDIINNNNVLNKLIEIEDGYDRSFSTDNYQTHRIVNGKYTDLYEKYLKNIIFPKNSNFGTLSLGRIYEQVLKGEIEDKINIVFIRYKTGQFRSPNLSMKSIKELPQGYNNSTKYSGDRNLNITDDCLELQVHKVYIKEDEPDKIIPMFALKNPFTEHSIRFVTGENYNEK